MISDESPAMRFTRRELLKRGSVLATAIGAGPIFAACGSGGNTASSSSPGATAGGVAGTINFYSWQGYDLLAEPGMKAWRTQHKVAIHSTYVSTHNDITAKFSTGGGHGIYNLSTYEAGYGPYYV